MPYLALASVFFAFLYLTRPVGLFFILGAVLFAVLLPLPGTGRPVRRRSRLLLALTGPFAVIVLLNAGVGYQATGEFRLQPARGRRGQPIERDEPCDEGHLQPGRRQRDLAGFQGPNAVSWKEASANATRIALSRISSDPVGFIRFSLTDKVTSMWGSATHGLYWSLKASPQLGNMRSSGQYEAMARLTDAFYLLSMLSFVAALAFAVFRKVPAMFLMPWLLPLLAMAALHVFIETQGRYHIPFMPFVYSAAALMIGRLSARMSRSGYR